MVCLADGVGFLGLAFPGKKLLSANMNLFLYAFYLLVLDPLFSSRKKHI